MACSCSLYSQYIERVIEFVVSHANGKIRDMFVSHAHRSIFAVKVFLCMLDFEKFINNTYRLEHTYRNAFDTTTLNPASSS